jgi:hypothetical protein
VFSVSVPISLAASEATSRLHFKASVTRSGQPATADEVKVTLVGDGSLQPGHDAKQLVRETDVSGRRVSDLVSSLDLRPRHQGNSYGRVVSLRLRDYAGARRSAAGLQHRLDPQSALAFAF